MPGYLRPVDPVNGRMSTYAAHTRRVPPSKEPGVDYYCPIGTPVRSLEAGVVAEVGGSIIPATGRYVKVYLDDGRSFRVLHLKEWRVRTGQRVARGTILGLSGASGYGSEFFGASSLARIPANTGGPHVHATLFPTHATAFSSTLDLERYIGEAVTAGGGSTPFPTTPEKKSLLEGDDMQVFMATSDGRQGLIRRATSYIQDAAGPLRPLSTDEYESYVFWRDHAASKGLTAIPFRETHWPGDQIEAQVNRYGLLEMTGPAAVPINSWRLTGRIIFAADDIRTPGSGGGVAQSIDYAALAKAVNDDAARRLAG